jgi:hypothetical protein
MGQVLPPGPHAVKDRGYHGGGQSGADRDQGDLPAEHAGGDIGVASSAAVTAARHVPSKQGCHSVLR